MKFRKLLLPVCFTLLLLEGNAFAQTYIYNYSVPAEQFGHAVNFPFAGGLNNPQFSAIDLNQDGKKDLYIFDRSGNKSLTFLNNGTTGLLNYSYWQGYATVFPELKDWVVLTDYNCDGLEDIITGFDTGIQTFLASTDGISITFTEDVHKLQYTEAGFNFDLSVGNIDIPGFADVDFDGDIDVLTFRMSSGGTVEYYQNRQIENSEPCGTWDLEHTNSCWGNFYESGITYHVDLDYVCKGITSEDGGLHAGSTFMLFDEDADNDLDLVLGDLAFGNLNKLTNGGDNEFAHITAQDTTFPAYDFPYDVPIFPAPFLIDLDNDGKKDMAVAPNNINSSANIKNVYFYKNIASDDTYQFDFQTDSFLVGDMIDLGEGAYPVFFDHNHDGLQDLIIGNYGYFEDGGYNGQLALFENTGTLAAPAFTLITNDYAGISAFNFNSLIPAFGDLDGDGDEDMLLGEENGFVHFFKNIAAPGADAEFILFAAEYQGIDPGQNSAPQLIDVNGDGLTDLIIGEKNGNLDYYQNTGTAASPLFTLQSEFWGNVDVRTTGVLTGYAVPFLTKNINGENVLYVGCEEGTIYQYTPTTDFSGAFTKVTNIFNSIDEGSFSSINGTDLNSDGMQDIITGNARGGVTLYRDENSVDIQQPITSGNMILLYPNPASSDIIFESISLPASGYCNIYAPDGRVVSKTAITNSMNKWQIDIEGLDQGLYYYSISGLNGNNIFNGNFIKF